ncbi:NADH dehydrogenase [ubiquinone] 1 alpha subcomplex subunit 7 isoform X3 [Coturnix japonica]|uniref:NADH dehydrogenase [ubiquinone] 1 alpha subcomplex subunit 7 isoform X3 n=1 Tax=Coturnix japonica TaxID=93934 RepID=UPI000776FD96|nr:NADH dehydrogenase [ubiquinone] 1 alpha subcomplex subunit 7 isoform X3 [Coturnix japonica]
MATATRLIQRLRNFLAGVRPGPPVPVLRRPALEIVSPCLTAGPAGQAGAALHGDLQELRLRGGSSRQEAGDTGTGCEEVGAVQGPAVSVMDTAGLHAQPGSLNSRGH